MAGKKFRFSLDSVLRLREHETQRAREELAVLMRERQEQEARVEEARRALDDLVRTGPRGTIGPRALRQFDAFRGDAQQAYEAAQHRLHHLVEQEEEARVQLMERRSAEETLRHLHDEEAARHRKDQEAAETDFLDEQAISSYYRQRKAADA